MLWGLVAPRSPRATALKRQVDVITYTCRPASTTTAIPSRQDEHCGLAKYLKWAGNCVITSLLSVAVPLLFRCSGDLRSPGNNNSQDPPSCFTGLLVCLLSFSLF